MKILIATGIFPPQIGGPATYSKLLYDLLPAKNIDVEIANFGDYLSRPKIIRHFCYFLELLKKAKDVDVIYAQDPVSAGLPALFVAQIFRKKFALKIVGDYAWEQGSQRWGVTDILDNFAKEYKKYPWQVRFLKIIEKYVAEGATKIITPSAYLKTIISSWGINPEKINVIYNGFHLDQPKETPSALRKHLKFTGPIIVTVGRLVPWKGIKTLVEILPEIIKSVPDTRLVIIGDGPLRKNLEEQVLNMSLSENVIFTGQLSQKNLFEYIKASDVFVLNTSYEGFSHQILETMALGTPVITTAVGGNVEIIKSNHNGILTAFDDKPAIIEAIKNILLNEKQAKVLADQAKKDVSSFTDEAMLLQITDELKNL